MKTNTASKITLASDDILVDVTLHQPSWYAIGYYFVEVEKTFLREVDERVMGVMTLDGVQYDVCIFRDVKLPENIYILEVKRDLLSREEKGLAALNALKGFSKNIRQCDCNNVREMI